MTMKTDIGQEAVYFSRVVVRARAQAAFTPGFEVQLAPTEGQGFQHLILVGPSGCGKSRLLADLALQPGALSRAPAIYDSTLGFDALTEPTPRGRVALLDNLGDGLHPAFQRKLLPGLTARHPLTQFIVATHSPLVAASVPNAQILQVNTGRVYAAEDLINMPYGQLLTLLFDLETDVGVLATQGLRELQELGRCPSRTPEEEAKFRRLARSLEKTNNSIALQAVLEILRDTRV